MSAGGALREGSAAKAAGEYNARVNEQNAVLSGARTESDVAALRREQARMLGSIRAAYGASGITMDGSASDVYNDNLVESELDVLNRKYSGELEAMGFRQTAKLDRLGGAEAARAGQTGAAATIIGAAGKSAANRPRQTTGSPVTVRRG